MERHYLCIDLKSFFASCECVERGIDGFKVPLVVANPTQGNGAITLAITPFLKAQGIKSRTRLYEIPPHIKYQIVKPRMSLYIAYSKKVISVYLEYVSESDLLPYSIDECFLDVTDYLKLYNKNDTELAEDILKRVYEKTGLTANCGIGPNMLLAKVAMDTDAKKYRNGISKWTMEDVPNKLWTITPLSKMWGIGKQMEKHLNNMHLFTIGDIANYDKGLLKKKFGVIGVDLWEHANGIDNSRISEYKNEAMDKSFSHSQVLFKDYDESNIEIIIKEMVDVLTTRLRKEHKLCNIVGLGIGYSKNTPGEFYHNQKLNVGTDSSKIIFEYTGIIFNKYYTSLPIRKVSISLGGLQNNLGTQLNLFTSENEIINEDKINKTIDEIKDKYGKNSILKAANLLEDSTAIERNKKIGGHSE
jgi:DNA polymerase V